MDTLGDDWQSKTIIDELKKLEVNCDAISVEAGAKASLASVLIRKSDGARAIRFVRSTSKPISKDHITGNSFQDIASSIVMVDIWMPV